VEQFLERSSPSDQLNDQYDDGDDKQQVDETSGDMEAEAQNP
jgi:hypothetical protein